MKKIFTSLVLLLTAASSSWAQQLYTSGGIATGATSKSGVAAPAGTQWSEVQNDAGNTTVSNTNSGISANKSGAAEVAEDFVVPVGQRWLISSFSFPSYQTGAPASPSPFTELYVRIWNGQPGTAGAQVIYGDNTTNRLSTATDALTYRIFNSLYPSPGTTPGTTRKVWNVTANFSPAVVLQPGTYWISWSTNVTGNAAHFAVPVTVANARTVPGANAIQFTVPTGGTTGSWAPLVDAGVAAPGSTPTNVNLAMSFTLNGTTGLAARASQNGPDGLSLQVGPVPATDAVQAHIANLRSAGQLLLTDAVGRAVWQGNASVGTTETAVPLGAVAPGVYSLELRTPKGSVWAQLVKN